MIAMMVHRLRVATLILTILLPLMGAVSSAGSDPSSSSSLHSSTITLTILNCEGTPQGAQARIDAADLTKGWGKGWSIVPLQLASDRNETTVSFQLLPGTYQLAVNQGKCDALFDVTALSGIPRHLALAMKKGVAIDYHYHNSLAGRLPFVGLQASLRSCDYSACDVGSRSGFTELPVTIDASAYYVNQLYPAKWFLRLYFPPTRTAVLIPIEGMDRPGIRYEHFERNFSDAEIRALWVECDAWFRELGGSMPGPSYQAVLGKRPESCEGP
jgi:hypothetical protein